MIRLALLLCLVPQEAARERSLDRLVEELRDDAVEVREAAVKQLIKLGPGAVKAIRKRAGTADVETRARLLQAVREIERIGRVRVGRVSRITLRAKAAPLREVVDEFGKQAPTRLVVGDGVEDKPVTLDLQGVPYFEAVDRLCRAHGGIITRFAPQMLDRKPDPDPFWIVPGRPGGVRRYVEDQFLVEVTSIRLYDTSNFRGATKHHMEMVFMMSWERGTRPVGVRFNITSMKDETGKAYTANIANNRRDGWDLHAYRQVSPDPVPGPSVRSFSEISGDLEILFPSDIHTARIENPVGRKGLEAKGGLASFTLHRCVRERDALVVEVEGGYTFRAPWYETLRFQVLGDDGKVYAFPGGSGRGTVPGRMRWTKRFDLPETVSAAELRAVTYEVDEARTPRRRIEWKLKDVRFR